jgi:hypothetical protein
MNNNASEIYYYSLGSLSNRVLDYGYVYFIPFACLLSILTNLISVIVLAQPNLKELLFKYMLLNSALDIITFSLVFWMMLVRCGSLCSLGYSYYSKIYEQYIFLYLQNVSQFYSNCLDLHITFIRLLVFSKSLKKIADQFISQRIKFGCIVLLGLLIPLNNIFTNEIVKIGSLVNEFDNSTKIEHLFLVKTKSIEQNVFLKSFLIILNLLTSSFFIGASLAANLILIYKFKKYIKGKRKLCRFKDINRPSAGMSIKCGIYV